MSDPWTVATAALLVPFAIAIFAAGRGDANHRLVAVSLASSIATFLLVTLDFAIDQSSSIDLALTLAVLTLPGSLLFALFQERWL